MWIRGLLTIVLWFALVGCSRVELAYDNADWWLARQVAGYLDLERDQRGMLRDDLAAYRQFHQQTRMPTILAFLESVDALLEMPAPSRVDVAQRFDAAEALIRAGAADAMPLAVKTLQRLDSSQIDSLEESLAEGRQTYVEDIAPAQSERLEDRLDDWFGEVKPGQAELIMRCSDDTPDVREPWLAWRTEIDERLVAALRSDAGDTAIEDLLYEWWLDDRARGEALFAARQQTRRIWLECTHQLLLTLDARQRDAVQRRLGRYVHGVSLIAER